MIHRSAVCAVAVFCLAHGVADAAPAVPPATAVRANGRVLRLRAGQIDTRARASLAKPGAALKRGKPYVLQFDGPMTRERRAALDAAGVRLDEYLPDNAWLVRIDSTRADAIAEIPGVAWLGEFDPAWKLAPNIGTATFATSERIALQNAGRLRLVVRLFAGADPGLAAEALDEIGAEWRDVQVDPAGAQIEIDLPADRLEALRAIEAVQFIHEAPEAMPRNDSTAWICQSNVTNNNRLWDAGLHGEGQIAGLIDWNMDAMHCAFNDPANPIGPAHRKILAYYGSGGGFNNHGTHVAGVFVGNDPAMTSPAFRGMAYESRIVFTNQPTEVTTANLFTRLELHHNHGARVHSNSWGNSSRDYIAWSRDIDDFTHAYEDDVVLVACDNANALVKAPENAKNCIAVNATNDAPSQGTRCFGAFGPTEDGRHKPDVWAPGCGSNSAAALTACGVSANQGGTSYATPAVAGMCILTRQYFTEGFYPSGAASPADAFTPTGALIKAIIINSATDMSGFADYYGFHEGYGRVLLDDALFFSGDARKLFVADVRHADGLATGEETSWNVNVGPAAEPLKITLVWNDAPAALLADDTPVNNLDLVVTDPDGNQFFGNVFSGLESDVGGSPDSLNNAEAVILLDPAPGMWHISVAGTAINVGPQGYALAISGDVAVCTKADVNLDALVDGADVAAFAGVLLNGGSEASICAADMNADGVAAIDDIPDFVNAVLGG